MSLRMVKVSTNSSAETLPHCFMQDLVKFLAAILEIPKDEIEDISWKKECDQVIGKVTMTITYKLLDCDAHSEKC